jgi:hypothetical protein
MLRAKGTSMGCFCHQSVTELQQKLQRLEQTAPAGTSAGTSADEMPAAAQQAQNVAKAAAWLAAHGLPAPAWQPDPAWLAAKLPAPQLDPGAMATLSALATLRAQSQQAFGLDPLQPGQAKPLARVVTTLNARLAALASGPPLPDPAPWHRLADESEAADAVQQAAKSGLLDPSPEQIEAYSQPAGRPMQQWLALLRQVRALAPLIAAAKQLDQPPDESQTQQTLTQRLADSVRKLRSVALPPLAEPAQAARLMSLLSASGRLRQSLGIDPAEAGYAEVQQAVAAKTAVAAAILRRQQQAAPANLPYCPSLIAPPAVVQAAGSDSVRELAAINWKVPPVTALPALQSGLSASTLAKQMAAALGASPVRPGPCGQGCDAAKIMRAAA